MRPLPTDPAIAGARTIALVAFLITAPLRAAVESAIPLELIVNGAGEGTTLVYVRTTDVLIDPEVLERAGVHNVAGTRETIAGKSYVSLTSLAPRITFEIDERAVALRLTAQPEPKDTVVDARSTRPPDIEYVSSRSAFVNYSVSRGWPRKLSLSGEAGVSAGGSLLFSSFSREDRGAFVRGMTNLTIDRRDRLLRVVVGDDFAATGDLGGSAVVGGISVSRNFALDPYFIRYPDLAWSGTALTPTTVEIYVNDILVRREQVAAGTFQLQNLPVVAGRGTARIVLRDSFGREEDIVIPVYFAPRLLARHLSEFSYDFGLRRSTDPAKSNDYGPPVLLAQHRYGWTDSLTVGYRAEVSRDLVNGGPTLLVRLPAGEVDLSAAASRSARQSGSAAALSWSFMGRQASFGLSARLMSPRYANLSLDVGKDRPRVQATAGAGFHLARGSITLQETLSNLRDAGSGHHPSLFANLHVTRHAALAVTASRSRRGDRSSLELYAAVNYYVGRHGTANVSHSISGGRAATNVEVQQPLPAGEGFGYRVRQETGGDGGFSRLVQYNAPFGRYEANLEGTSTGQSTILRASGGMVAIGGRLYFTRPVQDAFALIRLPGLPHIDGYASNQKIGQTDRRGDLLVPNILSYYGNQLRIAEKEIPGTYIVDAAQKTVAPPYRGGAIVQFPIRAVRNVMGSLVVDANGKSIVPAYGQVVVKIGSRVAESPVGKSGEFYLEDVPAGTYDARIEFLQGACTFRLDVPPSRQMEVQLGTVHCVSASPR